MQNDVLKTASEAIATRLDPLRPFMEKTATVHSPIEKVFLSCLSASFVKAFEFVNISTKQKYDNAFFFTPALRGITEEIIYFRFLSSTSDHIREEVIKNLQLYETHKCLEQQDSFFKTFRPFQPIISIRPFDIEKVSNELCSFWQQRGWPKLNKETPPVREIAEKSDPGILEVIYDFIYRLTSKVVHFSPQVLLRSGWGPPDLKYMTFNFKNMGPYYLGINQIYGSYLLCLYFEFFGHFFEVKQKTKDAVTELRKHILKKLRWPEMVTYEEMNIPVPSLSVIPHVLQKEIYAIILAEGFISGAKKILDKKQ